MREYAGGRPSQSSVARRPSPCTPTLLGTEGVLRCCVCCVVDFCLYATVLRMEHCADLVPVFFDIYSGILRRSRSWISSIFTEEYSIPVRHFRTGRPVRFRHLFRFFPVGWKCQPEEGGIGPGCCGGGVITTWAAGDGVIAAGSAV